MQGGCFEGLRPRCARRCAIGLLGGLLAGSNGLVALSLADAADAPASLAITSSADQDSAAAHEKSIIVQNGKGAEKAAPAAEPLDPSTAEALEPIANASEYAPDLADEPADAIEPTPADADATSAAAEGDASNATD